MKQIAVVLLLVLGLGAAPASASDRGERAAARERELVPLSDAELDEVTGGFHARRSPRVTIVNVFNLALAVQIAILSNATQIADVSAIQIVTISPFIRR